MKTNLLLIATLASATTLISCNKQVETLPENPQSAPAVMEIRLADSQTPSKAAGAPVEADETKVTKGMVFVFKGTGADPALDGKATFDFTSTNVTPVRINITQGIRQVYVVANINPADFASVNTLSDLQAISNKLTLNAFRTYAGGALAMSGFTRNVDATAGTTSSPTAVSVPLDFIGSRIHVDWDISQLNSGLTGLTIDGAAILNVKAKSEYIASDNGAGGYNALTYLISDYLQGVGSTTSFTGSYLPSVGMAGTTNALDTELFVPAANKDFANNYIYVFENHSSKPIIVAFKGTYNGKSYYWPIVINGTLNGVGGSNSGDQSGSVNRAMIYKVKAVIKSIGNEDPYAPINPGAMDVTVVPASWKATILIDQEFN